MQSETDTLPLYHRTLKLLWQRVRKVGGAYQHTGKIIAVGIKADGSVLVMMEFDAPVQGMVHVFRPDQVELLGTE